MAHRRNEQRTDAAVEYRRLYKTARWARLREWQLSREPLCRYCIESEVVEAATVCDHIKEHKGDLELFWNPDNLQSLCAPCHDGLKQRIDKGQHVIRFGPDGWPL